MRPLIASSLILLATLFSTSCGSGNSAQAKPGNTQVTVAVSGTGNDQLAYFDLVLNSLTLTDKSGNTASLVLSPQGFEFVQRNGQLTPAFTATVQQDTYVSATATVGSAEFGCVFYTPDQYLTSSTYSYGYTPDNQVTVNLSAPLTVSGTNMGLVVNLDTLQSASFPSNCWDEGASWSITPTFDIAPFELSVQPTNPSNGKVLSLNGEISAISASGTSFTLTATEASAPASTVTIATSNNTVYQGVSNFSALTVGSFVNLDGALQADSSVTASRIAVAYPSAVDTVIGPDIYVSGAEPALYIEGYDQQGADYATEYFIGAQPFSFDSAVFQISGQLSNLGSLPFVPSFTSANIVPGQNVYLSSPALTGSSNPYTELNAITLIPQTINGTITSSGTSGSFSEYSVSLQAYDLFPNLAVQPGQQTLLNDPSDVEVYVDSNTQLLNKTQLGVGGTYRFYGLIFNDNGTLRMDCAQINDGVAFLESSSEQQRSQQPQTQGKSTTRVSSTKLQNGLQLIKVTNRANPEP